MVAKVALGWGTFQAMNGYTPFGRLAVTAGNTADSNGAFTGWGGFSPTDTLFLADSNRTGLAVIKWLTGKDTGANILICTSGTGNQDTTVTQSWGNQFQKCMTDAGHTITVTGNTNSFGAYDPINFDVTCWDGTWTGTYHGLTVQADIVDYILAQKHSLFMMMITSGTSFDRYGISDSKAGPDFYHDVYGGTPHYHLITNGPTDWLHQMPFTSAELGALTLGGTWNTSYYAFTFYTNFRLITGTNIMGGVVEVSDCALQSQHTSTGHGEMGILGLWRPF